MKLVLLLITLVLSFQLVNGACREEDVTTYSTADINLSSQTVFLAEFSVNCDKEKTGHLYAEVNGRVVELAKGVEKYQASWTDKHAVASSGKYVLNIYDEEGFAMFRKVQRSGSEETTTTPMFEIEINHPGARSPKPTIPIESFFIIFLVGIMWFAFISKSRLLE